MVDAGKEKMKRTHEKQRKGPEGIDGDELDMDDDDTLVMYLNPSLGKAKAGETDTICYFHFIKS